MKKIIIICVLLLIQPVHAEYKPKNMDEVYKILIKEHEDDKEYIKQVKQVQKKWHEFVDAQRDLMYPGFIGIERRTCAGEYRINMDEVMTKLSKELFDLNDSDVCGVI